MSSAQDLQQKGVKLFQQKEYEAAAQTFQQALEAYEAEDKPDLAAEMRVNLGLVHRALGANQQALEAMQEALMYFHESGDQRRTAMTMGNMGGVYAALGDKEQAYNSYRTAADIFQALGEKKMHAETLMAMGDLQVRDGKLGVGAATYEAGLSELDNLTPRQKIIKGLIGIRNRITGMGNTD